MTNNKGYRGIFYMDKDNVSAKLTGVIEGDNETERTAARVMKALVPLMKEILESGDVRKLSGFVRGLSSAAVSMVLSLPPGPREAVRNSLLEDIERALSLPLAPPPPTPPGDKDAS